MQTTLLSIAIALILALLAALVGPHFIDWNERRAFFEAEASRLIGLDVRVKGPIAVGLLPVPSVSLGGVEIGPSGEAGRFRARTLGIALGLGPLTRGEIRAAEMRLIGPEFDFGLNSAGQIDWPNITLDAETLAIDKLSIEDGRATLTDAASQSRLDLEGLWFSGEVRSLAGPVRGEGAFVTGGGLFGYRVTAGQYADDGVRVRLNIETLERPMALEADGMLAFDRFGPRFDGLLSLARPAGAVLAGGKTIASEPWRLTGKVKANSLAALFEQVEYQYGPDERAVKLAGSAELRFGERPRFQGALSARQVDLDRLVATPEAPRRPPLATVQAFAELFAGSLKPQMPVRLAVSVDAVTLGGSTLQGVGGDLRSEDGNWRLDKLELRAPGFTQITLSGRLGADGRIGFAGAASVDASDPSMLMAWLAGRPVPTAQIRPWKARGELTLSSERMAVERLTTEFERGAVEGRLAYFWPAGNRPPRLEAELKTEELDIDGLLAVGESAFAGLGLERPREMVLGLDIAKARFAGFEARNATARLKLDARGIAIERLSLADFGNATIDAVGRIDTTATPGGNITVDLDARDLGGVIAMADTFAPPLAGILRLLSRRDRAAKLSANVSLEQAGAGRAVGKLDVAGRIGGLRAVLAVAAAGKSDAFVATDLSALSATDARMNGRLEADDGTTLLAALGFDRFAFQERRAARFEFAASGPLSRELRIESKLAAGPIDATGEGSLRLPADAPATLALDRLSGTVGGSKLQGRLAFTFGELIRIDGAIDADRIHVPSVIQSTARMRRGGASAWSSEPFARDMSDLVGRIEVKSDRAVLVSDLAAREFRGSVQLSPSQIVFEDFVGRLGNGRLDGRLTLINSGVEGLSARGRVTLSNADAAQIITAAGRAPVTGRLAVQAEVEGAGLSPAAFAGSLSGSGTIKLEAAQISGLNPRTFDAVVRAVELGVSPTAGRIRDFVESALDNGSLPVTRLDAALAIASGQMRISNIAAQATGAELGLTGRVDLADATVDLTMALTGAPVAPGTARPTVTVALRGPIEAPQRSVDVDSLVSWLALRAVDQQSRQLDAMEKARREAEERERLELEEERRRREAAVPAAPLQPPAEESAPAAAIGAASATPAAVPPPLPPPVVIEPAPVPRAAPRTGATPPPPQRPAAPRAADRPLPLLSPQH